VDSFFVLETISKGTGDGRHGGKIGLDMPPHPTENPHRRLSMTN